MKFRTLLLGTAAAFAVSGGAQAADLAIAVEPIDYVKICDAFGVGYWYIPGTDTCLKVGGYLQMDVNFYDDDRVGNYFNIANYLTGSTTDPSNPLSETTGAVAAYLYAHDNYAASWEFITEAGANFNSRSMSDLGVIATSINFVSVSNNNDPNGSYETQIVRLDGAYGAIGPIMFGWTASTFDPGGGYNYAQDIRSDKKVDQLRLSYLMGSWGIMLGIEDPRDRYVGAKNATGEYPDLVLAVTGGIGGFDIRAAAAVTDRTSGTGWGANLAATARLGIFDIKGTVAYSDNFKSLTGGSNCSDTYSGGTFVGCDDGQWWSGFLTAAFNLGTNFRVPGTISYQDGPTDGDDILAAALGLRWYPTARSEIGGDLFYTQTGTDTDGDDGQFGGRVRFLTNFN